MTVQRKIYKAIRNVIAIACLLTLPCMSYAAGIVVTSKNMTKEGVFETYVLDILFSSATGSTPFPYAIEGLLRQAVFKPDATSPPTLGTTIKLYDPHISTYDWMGDVLTLATTSGITDMRPYHNSEYVDVQVSGVPTLTTGVNTRVGAKGKLIIRVMSNKD